MYQKCCWLQPENNSSPSWERVCKRRREKLNGADGWQILLATAPRPEYRRLPKLDSAPGILSEAHSIAGTGRFLTGPAARSLPDEIEKPAGPVRNQWSLPLR